MLSRRAWRLLGASCDPAEDLLGGTLEIRRGPTSPTIRHNGAELGAPCEQAVGQLSIPGDGGLAGLLATRRLRRAEHPGGGHRAVGHVPAAQDLVVGTVGEALLQGGA